MEALPKIYNPKTISESVVGLGRGSGMGLQLLVVVGCGGVAIFLVFSRGIIGMDSNSLSFLEASSSATAAHCICDVCGATSQD